MDSFRAKSIQQSFIPFNFMKHWGQANNENPPQIPQEYYRYQNAELHNMSQTGTQAIMPLTDQQLFQDVQFTIKHPLSALGLLQIKTDDFCYWEIGALVTPKLIVTPYYIQEVAHATFYPAFNRDKYFLSANIRRVNLHHKKKFSVAQLDFSEDISSIVGVFGLRMAEENIFLKSGPQRRSKNNGRDQRNRRNDKDNQRWDQRNRRNDEDNSRWSPTREERDRRERRANQQNIIAYRQGKIIKVVTYASIQGVASLISIDLSMDEFRYWVEATTIQGICLYVHSHGFMSLIGVVRDNKLVLIKHDDVVRNTDQVKKKLMCPNMKLSEQEILWIASKKWNNLVTLDLQNNSIDAHACKHFASLDCTQLKELKLNKNPIRAEGYFELKKVRFPLLQRLELKNTLLGNDGCRWLSLTHLPNLIELNLRTNSILSSGCVWLVNANWPKLKSLNLTKNKFSNKGCEQLSRARWSLEKLLLRDCQIQDSGCKWLTRSKWPFLRELDLQKNFVSSQGYKWVGKGNWKFLAKLLLAQNTKMSRVDISKLTTLYSTSLVQLTIRFELSQFVLNTLLMADFPRLSKLKLNYQIMRGERQIDLKHHQITTKFPNCEVNLDERY